MECFFNEKLKFTLSIAVFMLNILKSENKSALQTVTGWSNITILQLNNNITILQLKNYNIPTEEYNKLLTGNINKMYKKITLSAINAINLEAKAIAKNLNFDEKIQQCNQNQYFITLKDHKENFQNNPKCRLINPAKSEIRIVSKHYIDQINKSTREKLNINQ